MRRAHGQISAVVVSDPPAGGVGAWKDELIQRNEKLCVVKLHTRTSHSIVPRAVRPSRDWRGGRWEVPGDQVVDRGRSTGPVLPCMPDSRVPCTLGTP